MCIGYDSGEEPMMPWKRWIVIGVSAGATIVTIGTFIIGGIVWFASRPPAWDTAALTVISGRADTNYGLKDNEFIQEGYSLIFALQNNTNRDITIPASVTMMQHLSDGGVLSDYSENARPYSATFIPAHQRAELSIKLVRGCTEEDAKGVVHDREPGVCYKEAWSDSDSLVLFDHVNHLQISLPKPLLKEFPPAKPK
jgi:hypothetical protein